MKMHGCLLATCLLIASFVHAEAPTGIKFFTGSWQAVLAEAKRQNKPIFVDIYTTWCGPCKLMAKQAFPDAKVGQLFNTHFINYQIDAQKGEGITIADTYAVAAYPTSLYVNGNGELIHRAVGYNGIPGMLAEAEKAIAAAKDPNTKVILSKVSAHKSQDREALAAYLTERKEQYLPDGNALDTYLTLTPVAEWTTAENLKLITGNITSSDSKTFRVLLDSVSTIRANPAYLTSSDMQKRAHTFAMPLMQVILGQLNRATTEAELERAITNHHTIMNTVSGRSMVVSEQEKVANILRRQFYFRTKNRDQYRRSCTVEGNRLMAMSVDSVRALNEGAAQRIKASMATLPDSLKSSPFVHQLSKSANAAETKAMSFQLAGLAFSYHELMVDETDLNQALIWSVRALEYNRNALALHTHAHLLNKLRRKAAAIAIQEEAIATAKTAGDDPTVYEKGLIDMRQP